jgi:hypothetical protein
VASVHVNTGSGIETAQRRMLPVATCSRPSETLISFFAWDGRTCQALKNFLREMK